MVQVNSEITSFSQSFKTFFLRKFLNIQCLENGFWEEGSCVPVLCKPPPPVFEGMYNCTNGFEFDSQCVLGCSPQSKRVRTIQYLDLFPLAECNNKVFILRKIRAHLVVSVCGQNSTTVFSQLFWGC